MPHVLADLTLQPLLGGFVLGLAALAKYMVTGRVLGISGAVRGGIIKGDWAAWRIFFNGGLLLGGLLAGLWAPAAFEQLPASFSVSRAAAGGLLVGVGASLGNGCTSGHGICGNARLSPRSFVYTLIFMIAGFATATWTESAAALGVAMPGAGAAEPLSVSEGLSLLMAAMMGTGALVQLAHSRKLEAEHSKFLGATTELATGLLFAAGLTLSGMVRPSKVAAFLSALHPGWDLSLMLVMGGALLVATPGFQFIKRRAAQGAKPPCATCYSQPSAFDIDGRLVAGGVLFGAGWGLSGMCPGPALVGLVAAPAVQTVAYVAAMVLGMGLESMLPGAATC